ncbi:GroES-like protein [Trametes polyzona]|nr:GroES-like protein [Trametes polyzona]
MAHSDRIPQVMKALVVQQACRERLDHFVTSDGGVAVQDHPVPVVGDDDVLVKNVAVAQNPTDYKFLDYKYAKPGTVVGCDFSGNVVALGRAAAAAHPELRVGAHVAGFTMGSTFADGGAFAEYVRTPASLVWPVPEGTFSHEEAATAGCAFWTAAQALYHPTRLGLVEAPEKTNKHEWIYIHGGSSAVGQFAIQLAVISGYKVVTTASPRNHALVRSLGANEVFDYRDPDVVQKVKNVSGDTIRAAFDTISERESQRISAEVIAPGGGKAVYILAVIEDATARTDVERVFTLLYWALGRPFTLKGTKYGHQPDRPEDKAHIEQFLKKMPALVKGGLIKPLPIKLWEGGLAAIPDGLQYMREGRVSAEKIVYRV